MQDLTQLVKPLVDLSYRAGEAICSHYYSAQADSYEAKDDDSPITKADLDAHAIIDQGLAALDLQLPILSEESTEIPVEERLSWRRYWLVDPLDGTKEFLARTGEFTVNIALIDQHAPVLGVLYLPIDQLAYVGIPGTGAWCYERDAQGQWHSRPLTTRRLVDGNPVTVLASRRHHGPRLNACIEWLESHWGAVQRKNSGSALKFCQLVDGVGDIYPRFSPCCEWDTAAGQALLEGAGGALVDLDGKRLGYNRGESLFSPNFYAIGDRDHPLWREIQRGSH